MVVKELRDEGSPLAAEQGKGGARDAGSDLRRCECMWIQGEEMDGRNQTIVTSTPTTLTNSINTRSKWRDLATSMYG